MHDTAFSSTLVWPVGLGLGTTVHALPFQCSVRPRSPPLDVPTAMHTDDAVHETALRNPPPAGLGVVSSAQVVPFELSATGVYVLAPKYACPTATQKVALVHDTPMRYVLVAPVAAGLSATLHVVPFHCSTRVPVPAPPTATQNVVEVQLTAASADGPAGGVLAMTVQDEPSHRSMSGAGPAPCCPTATQKAAFTQETSNRSPTLTVGVFPYGPVRRTDGGRQVSSGSPHPQGRR